MDLFEKIMCWTVLIGVIFMVIAWFCGALPHLTFITGVWQGYMLCDVVRRLMFKDCRNE